MDTNQKASEALGDIIQKGASTRQVGDAHPKKPDLVWTEFKPGKFDYRKKSGSVGAQAAASTTKKDTQTKAQKLKATLKKTDSAKLKKYANADKNDPTLRQMAYDELVERDEDVSDIDLDTGKYGKMKAAFGVGDDDEEDDFNAAEDLGNDDVDERDIEEWDNPDYIAEKFGKLKTKKQRIAADAFIHKMKIQMDGYKPPTSEIHDLNRTYAQFLETESPLMIASGGAGVGKSWNFHQVAELSGLKPFDPNMDEVGDGDYDYIEAPEVKTDVQLMLVLKEHDGKTILFDDSDNVLRAPDTLGILKKATASSGKRIIGKKSGNKGTNVEPFEFTGKIIFLTNMNQHDLTKNENLNAIYSRAVKKDINFTKTEQLSFIRNLKDKFDFTGVERLEDETEDKKERQEVFDLIQDNIAKIDPAKFNSRTMKEALEKKRAIDRSNRKFDDDPVKAALLFGQKENWKAEVENFLIKGMIDTHSDRLQKAIDTLRLDE